jgi:hypothetical protein
MQSHSHRLAANDFAARSSMLQPAERRIFGRGGQWWLICVVMGALSGDTAVRELRDSSATRQRPSMTNALTSHLRGPAPDGQMTDVQI